MIDHLVEDSRKALLLLQYLEATKDPRSASVAKLRDKKNSSGAVK